VNVNPLVAGQDGFVAVDALVTASVELPAGR
jgi:hypothetical protein